MIELLLIKPLYANLLIVIYPLKRYFSLLLNNNPSILDMLGVLDEHILKIDKNGKLIRDNYDLFLTQKVYYTFNHYANSQFRKLENYLHRNDIDYKLNNLQNKIDKFNENNTLQIKLNPLQIITKDNIYTPEQFKKEIHECNNIIDTEKSMKTFNLKDTTHLLKHCMHLIRLKYACIDLLSTGKIITYREKERQLLLDIRNGKYSYDEIIELSKKLDIQIEYAHKNTILPLKNDMNKINELFVEIMKGVIYA